MNNQQPNPLTPQGVPLDPKNHRRARVKIVVFFVLALHGIGLMALLMQGCRREEAPPPVVEPDTNMIAPTIEDTNIPPPIDTNYMAPVDTNVVVAPPVPVMETNVDTAIQAPPVGTSEYKVVQGDTFYDIAKKFNVTSRAIADANPTVNPARLQIGQTLVIPAPSATVGGQTGGTAATTAAGGGTVYVVKSGDNLTKIAAKFGVTIKALRSENNLATDRITVGQKLKIPAGGVQR